MHDTRLPNLPVPTLDLRRYAGMWHEMAHLPMFFQRRCVDQVTATYTAEADGSVAVLNACRTRDGRRQASAGVASAARGGALRVTFVPRWLRWLPFVWADYWVIDLDEDYQWAVVGGPARRYLWLLSRRPSIARALFQNLVTRAAERGYPVERLIMTGKVI